MPLPHKADSPVPKLRNRFVSMRFQCFRIESILYRSLACPARPADAANVLFPAPDGPDDRNHFAGAQRQIDAVQHGDRRPRRCRKLCADRAPPAAVRPARASRCPVPAVSVSCVSVPPFRLGFSRLVAAFHFAIVPLVLHTLDANSVLLRVSDHLEHLLVSVAAIAKNLSLFLPANCPVRHLGTLCRAIAELRNRCICNRCGER